MNGRMQCPQCFGWYVGGWKFRHADLCGWEEVELVQMTRDTRGRTEGDRFERPTTETERDLLVVAGLKPQHDTTEVVLTSEYARRRVIGGHQAPGAGR